MYPRMRKIREHVSFGEFIDMSGFIDSPDYNGTLYELVSISVHLGTINGGHYVAYCKKEDGCWYFMDDERIGKVSKEEVL